MSGNSRQAKIGSPGAGPFDKSIKENQTSLPDGCLQLEAAAGL